MAGLPAVFLDRDGVINRAVVRDGRSYPPARLEDVEMLSGAISSLQRLAERGYVLIGITNQPDVARGTQSREVVEFDQCDDPISPSFARDFCLLS